MLKLESSPHASVLSRILSLQALVVSITSRDSCGWGIDVTDAEFNQRLDTLAATIDAMPSDRRQPLVDMLEETRRRHETTCVKFAATRSALDDWRLAMKYCFFSLEAAHRELTRKRSPRPDTSDDSDA